VLVISEPHFEPTPADQFTPTAFGVREDQLPDAARMPWWVELPMVGFGLSILGGAALGCASRRDNPS
jgi:hypothetical protein